MSAGDSQHEPLIGRVIAGKIEIQGLIGGGAMGKVYRAHHRSLDKTIAIKVLRNRDGEIPAERLKIEARAASRLDHPNSVRVLDFGEDGDDRLLYIAMEYLEGRTLRQVLEQEGPIVPSRIARIVAQVCSALGEAHDKGIIHRDLKPANVMLVERHADHGVDPEFVKVCDFGLAKLIDVTHKDAIHNELTGQGLLLGTPGYIAPELARGRTLDGRSDLYACGVIMYRAAAGRPPYGGSTIWEVVQAQVESDPRPLSELVPGIDEGFAGIVRTAMARRPEDRYQNALELRSALGGFLERMGLESPWSDSRTPIRSALKPAERTVELRPPREMPTESSTVAPPVEREETASMAPLAESHSEIAGSPPALRAAAVLALVVVLGLSGALYLRAQSPEQDLEPGTPASPEVPVASATISSTAAAALEAPPEVLPAAEVEPEPAAEPDRPRKPRTPRGKTPRKERGRDALENPFEDRP